MEVIPPELTARKGSLNWKPTAYFALITVWKFSGQTTNPRYGEMGNPEKQFGFTTRWKKFLEPWNHKHAYSVMLTNCSSVTEDYLETQKLLELGVLSFSNLPLQERIGSSQISRFCCVETYAEFCKISHLIKYLLWVVDKRALCCSIIQGSWNHLFPLLLCASSFVCPKMKKVKIVQYKYTNKTDWKCCIQRC